MKNNAKASPLASAAHPFYAAHSIAEDIKDKLEDTAAFLIAVTRRSTSEAFERGEHLEKAAVLLPEGTLEKWAVECCGYTARHVRTQRAIHRNLAYYKEILVELAVGPMVLGKLCFMDRPGPARRLLLGRFATACRYRWSSRQSRPGCRAGT